MRLTVLDGGKIFDGTGGPPFPADVWMAGGSILGVGRAPETAGAERLDCRGMAVAPGFIDLHSHSDLQVLEDRREKVNQGVTTEVVGNCGFSPYPCGDHPGELREFANGIFAGTHEWRYASAREYLDQVGMRAGMIGVQSLVGHGSLRVGLFGHRQGTLEANELNRLEGELEDALAQGACGFSTGLMYAPGSSAPWEEIERLCRVVARRGKLYATHMRDYSFGLLEAVDEQLALARATGVRLQISHLQAVGRANWDKQQRALDRIEAARRDGVDVEFDIYPYQAGSTVLTQLLPQWALDGGTAALMRLLTDSDQRRRIAGETVDRLAQQWSDIFISAVESTANEDVIGLNLEQIADRRGVKPVEAAMDLLVEENGAVNMVSFNQSEDNLRALLAHELCSVISDGFYVRGKPHPRLYGTFPSLLGLICRERRWLNLAEAIHKITVKPARRLGLTDRGWLREAARADVTVFDPEHVASPADYESPEQTPVGIVAVFRGGVNLMAAADRRT
jgi:dihydroorotase/N-acyl-D-amino-acid deacylase